MPPDAKRVQAVFLAAASVDPAARAALLDRECVNDRELRRRVEALLRAHDEPDSMLDKSPGEAAHAPETLERIDPFVQRFEKAWQSGTPPAIDDFLPKDGPDRLAVLKELVMVDMERRGQAGTPARAEDYLERYPELARHFPTQQQDPPIQAATMTHDSPGERVGMVVAGRYKLLEQIGEGGMGTVWVAEQTQPVRRKVALKLIKSGMDSKTVLARFEAERQALALMDHPNIAKVLDGGTTESGRPYFVMEYVKGIPLTKYCDDARLSIAERLALFMPVCHAVQHAHQKGIIHRDLKPSNILVCLYDGVPLPKVIDFGLAKAMHQPLTEHTLHTAHGTMMGTPLYMSPEQAELNNLDVDTRTDIYSLGVILYELLTGTTPLERKRFKEAAWQEMLHLIKEEDPPKPSARLSGSGTLPTVAAQRKLEPAKLTKLVRGDLDWIAMKALEKERGRRYETANRLAGDIQHYLADEPVEATPPSASYRLRKFVRKHKKALVTMVAALVTPIVMLVVGLVFSLRYQEELKVERAKIEEAFKAEERALKTAEAARQTAETRLALALIGFGRTREGVAYLAKVSAGPEQLPFFQLAHGMAEYRSGNYVAAEHALRAAAQTGPNMAIVTNIAAFYRAMSLFRQGKEDEARKLAIEAAAKMKPLPKDENNPLSGNAAGAFDLIYSWLAYKEAKALIQFDATPPKAENDKK
jgi:serine/threonine protein kinase